MDEAISHVEEQLRLFEGDPANTQYQSGYHDALEKILEGLRAIRDRRASAAPSTEVH